MSNGTVNVSIGWGDTEDEAKVMKHIVVSGKTRYFLVSGSYIAWKGQEGTVDIEQSVAR